MFPTAIRFTSYGTSTSMPKWSVITCVPVFSSSTTSSVVSAITGSSCATASLFPPHPATEISIIPANSMHKIFFIDFIFFLHLRFLKPVYQIRDFISIDSSGKAFCRKAHKLGIFWTNWSIQWVCNDHFHAG